MATGQEKFQIVFEAQENASAKIRELSARLAELGGPQMVKSQNEIKKLERQIDQLSGTAKKGSDYFSHMAESFAIGSLAAAGAQKAMSFLTSAVKEMWTATLEGETAAIQLKGALDRLGLGTEANLAAINQFAMGIARTRGESDELVKSITGRLLAAGLSWSQTQGLISAALNSAAARGKEFGEVIESLTVSMETNKVRGFRALGVDVEHAKTAFEALEPAIKEAERLYGSQAQIAAGSMATRVKTLGEAWHNALEEIGEGNKGAIKGTTSLLTQFVEQLPKMIAGMKGFALGGLFGQMRAGVEYDMEKIKESVKATSASFGEGPPVDIAKWQEQIKAGYDARQKIIDAAAIKQKEIDNAAQKEAEKARDALLAVWKGYENTRQKTQDDIFAASLIGETASTQAIMKVKEAYARRVNEIDSTMYASHEEWSKARQANDALYAAALAQAEADARAAKIEFDKKAFDESRNLAEENQTFAESTLEQIQSGMTASVSANLQAFVHGRANLAQVFKGMASDFYNIFVKAVLDYVAKTLVVKLVAMLGGIFDNPTNDRMAAKQGSDFAFHFQRGVLGMLGNNLAAGIGQQNRITPIAQTAGGSGGTIVMNVSISGNILSDGFIEDTVAPKLQRLITGKRSNLAVSPEHKTGSRDVRFN